MTNTNAREVADQIMKEYGVEADPIDHVHDALLLVPDWDIDDLKAEIAARFLYP